MLQSVPYPFLGLNKSYQPLLFQLFTQTSHIDREGIVINEKVTIPKVPASGHHALRYFLRVQIKRVKSGIRSWSNSTLALDNVNPWIWY